MNVPEQAEAFLFEAVQQFVPYCHRYITRIVGFPEDVSEAEHRGTGFLCKIGDYYAVITALHVLTEAREEARFRALGISSFVESYEYRELSFPEIDIAVWVTREVPKMNDVKEFWPLPMQPPEELALMIDYAVVHGFPDRFSRYSAFAGYISESHTEVSWVRPRQSDVAGNSRLQGLVADLEYLRPVPDDKLRLGQFALNYEHGTGPIKTVDGETVTNEGILQDNALLYEEGVAFEGQKKYGAFGISGSPVWQLQGRLHDWDINNWSINQAPFGGIVTGWNPVHHFLSVTPVHAILNRLREEGILPRE